MAFLSRFFGRPNHAGVIPNANPAPASPPSVGAPDYTPGDPDGLDVSAFKVPVETRGFPGIFPSAWDGWPAQWSTAWDWGSRYNALVDIAWACIDRNATVLSTMPVIRSRTSTGALVPRPTQWMFNPDPTVYSSWAEFAKQLFRDFQLGEVFILPILRDTDDFPLVFRVVPPWMVNVEIRGAVRRYMLGNQDVTGEILHIRYDSSTDCPRGRGPLEVAGGRQITAGLIEKYTRNMVSTGGVQGLVLQVKDSLTRDDAQDLLNQYMTSRQANLGAPFIADNGAELKAITGISPKDMAMIEVAQFNEARIAILLGVPPFIMALPGGGDALTYANVSQLFDQHVRLTLRPMAHHVMSALSAWALPSTERVELDDDEYSRPDFATRAEAYAKALDPITGWMTVEEVRAEERLAGDVQISRPVAPEPTGAFQ